MFLIESAHVEIEMHIQLEVELENLGSIHFCYFAHRLNE